MNPPKIFESEYRFCLILWETEPVSSRELVRLAGERLGWKPTTVYTVIKRLSERGVLKNERSVVTSLVSKEDVQSAEIDDLLEKTFGGSLPAFVAAFARRKNVTDGELAQMERMIAPYRKENGCD